MYGAGFKTCPIFFVACPILGRLSEYCIMERRGKGEVTAELGRRYGESTCF